MSLDIIFEDKSSSWCDDMPEPCYTINITHNLGRMAEHVPVKGTNLYQILWEGYDLNGNRITTGSQFEGILEEGIDYMLDHKDELIQYEPSNGWGNFYDLLNFTRECLGLATKYPYSKVSFSG